MKYRSFKEVLIQTMYRLLHVGVFQLLGIATEMMIAWTEATSLLVTANPRVEHVSAICLRVIMATVFPEFISAMGTTIVLITPMKMSVINVVSFTIEFSLFLFLSLTLNY